MSGFEFVIFSVIIGHLVLGFAWVLYKIEFSKKDK